MKQIGLVGFNIENFKTLKLKYKNLKLIRLEKLNTKNLDNLSALIAFDFEKINKFLISRAFVKLKNLEWVHVPIAGVDKYIHLFNDMKFTLTCGKKINDKNVAEHCIALIFLCRTFLSFTLAEAATTSTCESYCIMDKRSFLFKLSTTKLVAFFT